MTKVPIYSPFRHWNYFPPCTLAKIPVNRIRVIEICRKLWYNTSDGRGTLTGLNRKQVQILHETVTVIAPGSPGRHTLALLQLKWKTNHQG